MPTDLGATATPEFTAVVDIPNDAEVFDEAAIVTMLQPLVNRTEYLNSGNVTKPWKLYQMFHDFVYARTDSGNNIIHTDSGSLNFQESGSANFAVLNPRSLDGAIGVISFVPGAAAVGEMWMRTNFDQIRIESLRSMTARLAFSGADNVAGRNFEIGFFFDSDISVRDVSGTNQTVSIIKDSSIGTGFYLRTVNAGVETLTAISSSTTTADEFDQLQITHDGAGNFSATFNEGTPVTLAMPFGDPVAFGVKYAVPSSGAHTLDIDFIQLDCTASGRVL